MGEADLFEGLSLDTLRFDAWDVALGRVRYPRMTVRNHGIY
jgi:hypothetical protein